MRSSGVATAESLAFSPALSPPRCLFVSISQQCVFNVLPLLSAVFASDLCTNIPPTTTVRGEVQRGPGTVHLRFCVDSACQQLQCDAAVSTLGRGVESIRVVSFVGSIDVCSIRQQHSYQLAVVLRASVERSATADRRVLDHSKNVAVY